MILALITDPDPNPDPNSDPNPDPNPDPTPDPSRDPGQVRMDRGAFTRLLGPLDSLLELRRYTATGEEVAAPEGGGEAGGEGAGPAAVPVPPPGEAFVKAEAGSLTLADLSVTKGALGEGAFGKARRAPLLTLAWRTHHRPRPRPHPPSPSLYPTAEPRAPTLTRCAAAGSRRAARCTLSSRCARRTSSPWGRWRDAPSRYSLAAHRGPTRCGHAYARGHT